MKVFKKLAGVVLAACLMIPMFATLVSAADGVLMFSDPSTKVGENVSIDLVVQSSSGTVGDVNVSMNYDTTALEFLSGDGFSADGAGGLTYTGTGSSSELRSTMTFRALKQTDTQITVNSSSALLSSGDTLNLSEGSSAISIAAADDGTTSVAPSGAGAVTETPAETPAVTGITVSVNGIDYSFSEAFTTSDIPSGYSETTMTFNGEDRKFVSNEAGTALGYLVDSSGTGSFFLFNSEDATFVPFAQLTISDTTSIIPLDNEDAVSLPDNYEKSTLTVQGQPFPTWSDPAVSDRFYVIYALNTRTNEAGLYQYDSADGTYQYFLASADTEDGSGGALPGKFGQFISEHVMAVVVAAAVICLLLFILMIVFAVKLVHRNQELDDLYDEYDIPFDDEEDTGKKTLKKSSAKDKKQKDDEYDEDDFEDDDEYDDEYDDDDDEYADDEYDEYDDDDEYDDEDDGKGKDYDINFIDL